MRSELAKLGSARRYTFLAEFKRYGSKRNFKGWQETTLLFSNIRERTSCKLVCDHIWFTDGVQFKALGKLNEGDVVQFDARVDTYVKGYQGRKAEEYGESNVEQDYRLSRPTRIKPLEKLIKINKILGRLDARTKGLLQ